MTQPAGSHGADTRAVRDGTRTLAVTHETVYRYEQPVTASAHVFRLRPVHDELQAVLSHRLDITRRAKQTSFEDLFGNSATHYRPATPFTEMRVVSHSTVRLWAPPPLASPAHTALVLPLVWPPSAAPGYPPSYFQQPSAFGERANFGTRLGAWLLDGLLYGLLSMLFVVPGIVLIAVAFSDCEWVETSQNSWETFCPPGEPNGGAIAGGIVLILIGVLLVMFIYVRAMGKTGQTWGARIVGVKVIDERTGSPIGFGRALGRSLFASLISANVFYLGYLWMLWDDKKQTWQDKVVNSVVVKT